MSEDFDQGKVAFCPLTFAQYRTYQPYPYRISKYTSFKWSCISTVSYTHLTIITFGDMYLNILAVGTYHVKVTFEDGIATTTLLIKEQTLSLIHI